MDRRYTGMELSGLKADTGEEVELEAGGGEAEVLVEALGAAGERKLSSWTAISLDFPAPDDLGQERHHLPTVEGEVEHPHNSIQDSQFHKASLVSGD